MGKTMRHMQTKFYMTVTVTRLNCCYLSISPYATHAMVLMIEDVVNTTLTVTLAKRARFNNDELTFFFDGAKHFYAVAPIIQEEILQLPKVTLTRGDKPYEPRD
jgi:hypothetical protein